MSNKVNMDERVQFEHYRAGYYAFMATVPLMAATNVLFGMESTKDTFLPPLFAGLTYFLGVMIFAAYLSKKRPRMAPEEQVHVPEQKKRRFIAGAVAITLSVIALLIVGVTSGFIAADTNIEAFEGIAHNILYIVAFPAVYYLYYRQAKKKSVSHGKN